MRDDTVETAQTAAAAAGGREPSRGDVIGRRWQLEGFLSRGGMGRVWRAIDLRLGETVAIKLMDPALVETDGARERFMREAQAAARLRGPNVVQVLDFDVDDQRGLPYMAMELLRGEDLARRLERGPLGFEATVPVIADICAGIGRAHRMQIIHRDLKPGNIFLLEYDGPRGPGDPVAKILDFGIVKLGVDVVSGDGRPLTLAGTALGTVSYMSPEQIENARAVDHRADLWSIGILAFECVTGERPYRNESVVELIREICLGEPARPSAIAAVPPGFDAWFAAATHRDPKQRFVDTAALIDSLRALAGPSQGRASGRASARASIRGPGRAAIQRAGVVAPAAHLESWASDANQIDIRALEDLTFKNAVVHEYLESANKHFVSGSKGLGKTLLLTYKRFLLSEQYQGTAAHAAVRFVPEGRPYLDLMSDLPSVRQATIDLMSSLDACKRIWRFGLRVSALSYSGAIDPRRAADLDADLERFPRRLRAMVEGKPVEPTMVVKELLSLSVGQINRLVDETEGFLEYEIRSLHSGMFFFVDKLDQALRQLPREAWVHMQAGMLEAAWDLMNTNPHLKVFATIREEAFSSYESDIKTNLYGATSTLRYSKPDLEAMLEKLTFFYERLALRDFVILDAVSGPRASRREASFDFIYRHTLCRPRDLVIVASEISRNRDSLDEAGLRRLVQETSASLLVSNVFDEMRVFVEVLRDRDQRARFFASLPYNVLTHDELVALWCAFHGVDREYYDLHGHEAGEAYHPFRELYDCGLLGVITREPGSAERRQRFRQPYDAVAGSQRQLPRSRYYLLHPSLETLIVRLAGGGRFQPFRHVITGHGEPWSRHYGPMIDVQRELHRLVDTIDEALEDDTHELLARLDARLAAGASFEDARARVADDPSAGRVSDELERRGYDELHLALLDLLPDLHSRAEPDADTRPQAEPLAPTDHAGDSAIAILIARADPSASASLRAALTASSPILVRTKGSFRATFPTVAEALAAARSLRARVDPSAGLRMVVHRGPPDLVERGDGALEVQVDAERSNPGEPTLPQTGRVLVSEAALRGLPASTRDGFAPLPSLQLVGLDRPESLWIERE